MRKTSDTTNFSERNSLRAIAAIALTGSLALFGCSTNKYPGNGEPAMSAPAAGSVAPNPTSTPGSSSGTPQAMISSSPAAGISNTVDAIAVLKADEAYRGKVLGPAAPGDISVMPLSMQQTTGQFISPSNYANPQITVNSSISSAPTPAIVSGAGEGIGGAAPAIVATGVTAGVTAPAAAVATPVSATAAVRSATATPIASTNAISVQQAPMINTGLTTAPAVASNVAPTPVLGTTGPLTTGTIAAAAAATNAGGSTLGVSNNGLTAGVTAAPVVVGTPTATNTFGIAPITATSRVATTATTNNAVASDRLNLGTSTTASAAAPIRVTTTKDGAIVVSNERSQSAFQRFLTAVGLRRAITTGTTP